MKNLKYWITTSIGLVIVGFGGFLLYESKIEWYVFLFFALAGLWLFNSSDEAVKRLFHKVLNKKL